MSQITQVQLKTLTVALARQRHPAVGRNRLYQALTSRALPSVKVGRRIAIHVDDLDAWVSDGCPTEQHPSDAGS